MKREPEWKQDTPRMQIATFLQSAQGDVWNEAFEQGQENIKLKRALVALEMAQAILREMPEGEWEGESKKPDPRGWIMFVVYYNGRLAISQGECWANAKFATFPEALMYAKDWLYAKDRLGVFDDLPDNWDGSCHHTCNSEIEIRQEEV